MAKKDDPATQEWRRRVGLSKEDLATLPPEKVSARENSAVAEEFFRSAKVHRVDRWDENTALLFIATGQGLERHWLLTRIDGAWKIDNFQPSVRPDGRVIPRSGEPLREGTVPVDGFGKPAPPLRGGK
jgi:hypothetical protein